MRLTMTTESQVIAVIKSILRHRGLSDEGIELSSQLYEDGIGLDSLSVAELSAALEKEFGTMLGSPFRSLTTSHFGT